MTVGSPGTGALRVARAAVLAVLGLALAVGGHVAGGGSPSLVAVLVVGSFSAATFGLLADRRLGLPAIAACMAASQLAFHVVMSLQPAHAMPGVGSDVVPSPPMLAGHAAATVLASLLLARGERLVWMLAALLAPVVRLLLPRGTGAGWLRPWRPQDDEVLLVRVVGLLEVGLRHRGPPATAAV